LLANCKAFLFPSLLEGFGLPPIEAMYFGKAVVVARRTSLPEVCGSEAGYFDSFEPEHMKQASIKAVAQHQATPQARASALVIAASRHNWQHSAERYLTAYQQT
jgi:glycosyltransferase involved in cell wall biosynthesis